MFEAKTKERKIFFPATIAFRIVTNNSEFKKSGSDKLYIKIYNAGLETLNNLYLRSFFSMELKLCANDIFFSLKHF